MKRWLSIIALAVGIAFVGGIGETQTKSQFPKVDIKNAIGVEFSNCNDVIFSITAYSEADEFKYIVYEVGNVVFAILEFDDTSDKAIAAFILQQNRSILKFKQSEFSKLGGPCKTIETLKLKNDHNTF